jgi:phosphoglycerate dehydrogenase-like enzyme
MKLLHLAAKEPVSNVWTPLFIQQLSQLGELRVEAGTADWDDDRIAELASQYDIIVSNWGSRRLPEQLAEAPGQLKYICNLTGEIRPYVPRCFVEQGIVVTNWGSNPAFRVAEGALSLLLASLKEIIPQQYKIKQGEWRNLDQPWRGSMLDLRLGVYGMGVIGRAFVDFVRPLQSRLFGFDPYASDWPDGIERMQSLEDLFNKVDAVVITAALTEETRLSVTGGMLAGLPNGGIVINVARGAIIDQPALFSELRNGRLRAGLDVLDTNGSDWVPPGHPARDWPNLILSAHKISSSPWNQNLYEEGRLSELQLIGLDNIKRFVSNKPLQNTFDLTRYDRST